MVHAQGFAGGGDATKAGAIFVVPKPIPEARPLLLTVATEVLEEVQVAVLVRSCVDPLLNKPVAEYCSEPQVAVTG